MGCTLREKHIKASRRARSVKPTSSSDGDQQQRYHSLNSTSANSMLESGLKPWTHNMGFNGNRPDPGNSSNSGTAQNPGCDHCSRGYCTEEQLEELLLKNLELLYAEAISKLVGLGYDEEVALDAILKHGHCYGGMDVLTNIVHNSLVYLNGGCCGNDGASEDFAVVFTDLKQLEESLLEGMVLLLQQLRPHLSRGDAMWCLLMSDLHVGRASTLDIPMHPPHSDYGNGVSGVGSSSVNAAGSGISVPPGMCKFNEGWGFGNGANSELPEYDFGDLYREVDYARRFNLSSSMKSSFKKNVGTLTAGFRTKQQLQQQMQSQPFTSSATSGNSSKGTVPNEVCEESHESNLDIVNSVLNKLQDLNLGESLENASDDQKDNIIMTMLHQIKDLEKQVRERKEWAQEKAMQAARKLSNDLTELKILRMESEETQLLRKGKQTLEDTTMKRLSEMENALRKASSQVDRANANVRELENENAEIRAEMVASKLSASESATACSEAAKREKKCLKRLVAWEKQKTKLQEEIAAEKRKIADLQQQLVQTNAAQKELEAKWRQEVKEKELAMNSVEEERRSKETTESNNKRKLEALRSRIDIDFQRHKDDLQRLEQELSHLKASAHFTEYASNVLPTLSHEEPEKEGGERMCMICMKDEVSVVFLPCAHQVMCVSCGEDYGKKGRATCPCCRVPIEQRIRVFGASS